MRIAVLVAAAVVVALSCRTAIALDSAGVSGEGGNAPNTEQLSDAEVAAMSSKQRAAWRQAQRKLAETKVVVRFKGPYGPDPALGPVLATTGPNKGQPCSDCIFVGVTTCCKSWDRTQKLLTQLLASNDNMHIMVFDDMSEDDSTARVQAMGVSVLQPPNLQNIGLTQLMNLMWRYFYARPELVSMFVVNNDLEVSPYRTFEKLNRCLQSIQVGGNRLRSLSLALLTDPQLHLGIPPGDVLLTATGHGCCQRHDQRGGSGHRHAHVGVHVVAERGALSSPAELRRHARAQGAV
jgi:hypothetical protein